MEQSVTQSLLFPDLFKKPVTAQFDQEHGSSDGGAILLKAADRQLGLIERLASCVSDSRQSGKLIHELPELFAQRIFGIACGYSDCNDAARLAGDPMHKMLVGRDPIDGDPLASQSTLSRFENSPSPKDLYRLGSAFADTVFDSQRRRLRKRKVRRVTLDLDVTHDATHGQQQLSFFNGYYDTHCYLPLLAFLRFNDEPEQYLTAAVLRAGNAPDKLGARALLKRLVPRIWRTFRGARVLVRLDGGFTCPEILDLLDALPQVDYVCGLANNAVLKRKAKKLMKQARRLSRQSGQTEHVYGECLYQAQTWSQPRRVIIKAEVVCQPGREPRDNCRFVVTNLVTSPRHIYKTVYCYRGELENRVKELKDGMQLDRTSCSSFWANQFRVLMTAAAYALLQHIRCKAARTRCARAQVSTLRERLLKLGVHVVASVRRIVLHLPASYPWMKDWQRLAQALGASPG